MFGIVLPVILLALLYVVGRSLLGRDEDRRIIPLLIGTYLLRLGLSFIVSDLPIFSYGSGGDASFYEANALTIARMWEHDGISFVTADVFPDLGYTTLPSNVFALISYLNGERTHFACTALVAFVSVVACLIIYRLTVDLGADHAVAFNLFCFLTLMPAYLFMTSDTYKDGMVVFLVATALLAGSRLAKRFSLWDLALGSLALWGIWFVRFYLLFIVSVPFVIGFLGPRARNPVRLVSVLLLLVAAGALVATRTSVFASLSETAETTYEFATMDSTIASNANVGSGLTIEGTGVAAFCLKLFLLLFAPLPWQGGSISFQIGKIETITWYFLFLHTVRGGRLLWRSRPVELAALLSFLLPCTFIYATTYANAGLAVRMRFSIVMLSTIIAAHSLSERRARAVATLCPPQPSRATLEAQPQRKPAT